MADEPTKQTTEQESSEADDNKPAIEVAKQAAEQQKKQTEPAEQPEETTSSADSPDLTPDSSDHPTPPEKASEPDTSKTLDQMTEPEAQSDDKPKETPDSTDSPDDPEKASESDHPEPKDQQPAPKPQTPPPPMDPTAAHDSVEVDQRSLDIEQKIEQVIQLELDRARQPDRAKQLFIGLGVAMVVIWVIFGSFILYDMFLQ